MKTSTSILIVFLLFSTLIFGQTTRYVTSTGAGNKNGSSWTNASDDLQAMINASSSGDRIYVAIGTYMPNRRADATGTITPHNRYNSFVMKQGVSIYGGFDPANGITDDLNSRILPGTGSGSLLSGNLGNLNSIDDNAYHVVVAAGGSSAGFLDGFLIQDGNAGSTGSAITVNGREISRSQGGGIVIANTNVIFQNCWVRGNRAGRGGGVYIYSGGPTHIFTNCIFSGNYATSDVSGGYGGGLYIESSADTTLNNCTISSNRGSSRAGAILTSGNVVLNNSIIYGNTSSNESGVRIDGGSLVAQYCLIGDSGHSPTSSIGVTGGSPSFVNATGTGGTMPTTAGDYRLNSNSSCIDTGNNSLVPSGILTHIGGFSRVQNETVDRGAFEAPWSLILYVKSGGTGSGLSWADAVGDLQYAINLARPGDIIFVSGGTYKPSRKANALTIITPNNRDNAFVLKNGVKIYGGFAGNETSLSQRDLSNPANKTILSGDFNDNDVVSGSGGNLNITGNDENAYHVVIAAGNLGTGTVLDGFIIKGGNANGTNDITVSGDVINRYRGGGIYSRNSSPIIRNNLIRYNQAGIGAGMVRYSGSPQIINCVFNKNRASTAGSALRLIYSGNITIINSTFFGNRDNGLNGVIFGEAPVILRNSIVYGNNSGIGGSGSISQQNSLVQGRNSTANGNIPGNINPRFMNALEDDFSLQLLSPVANKGNNSYVPADIITDIAGNTRIQDCAVDMGAYESNPIPAPIAEDQEFCAGNTFADIIAEGENLQWYNIEEGGSPLDENTELTPGTYYVSQTINGCESPRTTIVVTYHIDAPIVASPQTFSTTTTVSDLEATGSNLQWYNVEVGGIALSPSQTITAGTYYVSQTIDGCQSPRAFVEVITSYTIRYVKPVASGSGDGSSWENASGDLQAMINASNTRTLGYGDTIFVASGIYKPNRRPDSLDIITPNQRENSFVLKNNIRIHGGFAGWETSLDQRVVDPSNPSILSGDFNDDDVVSGSGSSLSISGNDENACHIVISATSDTDNPISRFTVLEGFTIKGGNANDPYYWTELNNTSLHGRSGGGFYNKGTYSSPKIVNCIFTENQSMDAGGAVHTEESANDEHYGFTIINSVFYNNITNGEGGALALEGGAKLINCTGWGNIAFLRGGFISIINNPFVTIYNTIAYGNEANNDFYGDTSGIFKYGNHLYIRYSMIEGDSTDTDLGNIPETDPQFVNPQNGDFRLQPTSPVINRGGNGIIADYHSYTYGYRIDSDIVGNDRIQDYIVDMGAYESSRYGVIWTTSDNWLNNVEPDQEKDVFIEGDLEVGTDYGSFEAKTLTVEEAGSIRINEGSYVEVSGKITNANEDDPATTGINEQAEAFVVRSGGNLIQNSDYQTDDNEGKITVERESQEIVRLDYTLWGSPVKGQQIQAFSPMTLPNRIYTYETNSGNENDNGAYEVVNNVNADFTQGKGYLFRAPNDWIPEDSETGIPYPGKFIGEPTNGNISILTYPNGFTSVGNPYPSNIDPQKLLTGNSGVSNLFFWNNPQRIYNAETENWGYTGTRYVAYSSLGFNNPDYEGKSISVGQGFIVYTTGSSVHFDNSMRASDDATFFKTDETERHRFWLKLKDRDNHTLNDILIGYMTGSTNEVDQQIEGEQFGYEGSAIYNLINEQKYAIQGRGLPFETSDVVPLGFKAETGGKYTISLTNFDGLFAEGEVTIYLKDKSLDIVHSLMESDYEFESEQGEFKDRFEIVYREEETMGVTDPGSGSILIYQHDQNIVIDSGTDKILSVGLYDLQGRSLYRNESVNSNYHQIPSEIFGPTVLIVKVQTRDGKTKTKKILNK
ncbi:MAG: choice-of-anchor Q domain-containing protein [Moheibacter sp.]